MIQTISILNNKGGVAKATTTVNLAADGRAFIIPVMSSYLSLEGIVRLGDVVRDVRTSIGEAC